MVIIASPSPEEQDRGAIGSLPLSARFRALITRLADGSFAVLDRIPGALVDAGHAVGTFVAPGWFTVLHGDVGQRADINAFPA